MGVYKWGEPHPWVGSGRHDFEIKREVLTSALSHKNHPCDEDQMSNATRNATLASNKHHWKKNARHKFEDKKRCRRTETSKYNGELHRHHTISRFVLVKDQTPTREKHKHVTEKAGSET